MKDYLQYGDDAPADNISVIFFLSRARLKQAKKSRDSESPPF